MEESKVVREDVFRGNTSDFMIYLKKVKSKFERKRDSDDTLSREEYRRICEYIVLIEDVLDIVRDRLDTNIRAFILEVKEKYGMAKDELEHYTAIENRDKELLEEAIYKNGLMLLRPCEPGYDSEIQRKLRDLYDNYLGSVNDKMEAKRYCTILRCILGMTHKPRGFFKKAYGGKLNL